MSGSTIKNFIYVDKISGRVLLIKKSLDADFSLTLNQISVFQVVTSMAFPMIDEFNSTYDPLKGLQQIGHPQIDEIDRLHILRRKVQVLNLIQTTLHLIQKDINLTFRPQAINATPISPQNFRLYWNFLREEKRIVEKKIRTFFAGFERSIEAANDIPAVDEAYNHLIYNMYLGVYSPTNRERKGIGIETGKCATDSEIYW